MKIVNVIGGLGNQMFQYAFAERLRQQFPGERVLLDTQHFRGYRLCDGYTLPDLFGTADLPVATRAEIAAVSRYIPDYRLSRAVRHALPKRRGEYVEKAIFQYLPEVFELPGDVYYEGYWQNYGYFAGMEARLRALFRFPAPEGRNAALAERLAGASAAAVHIRRGDYLKNRLFRGICELDYYERALAAVGDAELYCIFSNDIPWCEAHIRPLLKGRPVVFADWNRGAESYWDMYLMGRCRSLIIANSTFSWWGAFLAEAPATVVAPKDWVNGVPTEGVCPPEWKRI